MTCKDCIHRELCTDYVSSLAKVQNADVKYISQWLDEIEGKRNQTDNACEHFADRSLFVELPCVAGEYVYVIEPIFGKSIEHTIRRRKIKSIEPHAEIKFYGSWIHDFLSGFGRYIFSTYEEAEQALKEREENE